jgi:hypothetical protein
VRTILVPTRTKRCTTAQYQKHKEQVMPLLKHAFDGHRAIAWQFNALNEEHYRCVHQNITISSPIKIGKISIDFIHVSRAHPGLRVETLACSV